MDETKIYQNCADVGAQGSVDKIGDENGTRDRVSSRRIHEKEFKIKKEKYKINHFYDIRNDGNYIHETYSDDYKSRKMK